MKFEHNSQGLSPIFLQFAGELSLVGLHMNILNTGHQKSTICKSQKMRLNLRSILAKRIDFFAIDELRSGLFPSEKTCFFRLGKWPGFTRVLSASTLGRYIALVFLPRDF